MASFRVEAAFLSSDAAKGLVEATGVQVPTVLSATVDTPTDDPLDAASLLFLRDFSPDDGYRQSNLLAGDDLRATLKALARFHAHFSEAARRPRPEEKWRCGGHWQPAYQNAEQFESGVEAAWPRLLDNFRSVLDASPATRDLDLEALGGRVQRAAVAAGRAAHPFARRRRSTDVEEWRTLIHGDLKAANVLVKGDEVALLDFQYVGDGLAATDLAHFLTASVAGSELLGVKTGRCSMDQLVDIYLAEFATMRDIDGDAFRRQFEVAVVDKARFVFSYLWPRIDASPAELERAQKSGTATPTTRILTRRPGSWHARKGPRCSWLSLRIGRSCSLTIDSGRPPIIREPSTSIQLAVRAVQPPPPVHPYLNLRRGTPR